MELILIRHARPLREHRADGAAANPGLDAEGREQAEHLARWLAVERIDAIVSSPARRAWQTAEPLAAALDLQVGVVDALREFDTGANEYVPVEELTVDDPRWQAMVRGEFYGCADPEAFRRRVIDGVEQLVDTHPGGRVAAFSHAGTINVYTAHVLSIAGNMWFAPGYASITRITASRDGRRGVLSVNEAGHLHPAYLTVAR
ncbi:MAG: histidine phosphatase family protein [Pseudonocardiaceae bacterium]